MSNKLANQFIDIAITNFNTDPIPLSYEISRETDIISDPSYYDISVVRYKVPFSYVQSHLLTSENIKNYQVGLEFVNSNNIGGPKSMYWKEQLYQSSVFDMYGPEDFMDNVNRTLLKCYSKFNDDRVANNDYYIKKVVKTQTCNFSQVNQTDSITVSLLTDMLDMQNKGFDFKFKINSISGNYQAAIDKNMGFSLCLISPTTLKKVMLVNNVLLDYVGGNVTFVDYAAISQYDRVRNTKKDIELQPLELFGLKLKEQQISGNWSLALITHQLNNAPDTNFDFTMNYTFEITLNSIKNIWTSSFIPYFSWDSNKLLNMNYSEAFAFSQINVFVSPYINTLMGMTSSKFVLSNYVGSDNVYYSLTIPQNVYSANVLAFNQLISLSTLQNTSTYDSCNNLQSLIFTTNMPIVQQFNKSTRATDLILTSFNIDGYVRDAIVFADNNGNTRKYRITQEDAIRRFIISAYIVRTDLTNNESILLPANGYADILLNFSPA